MSAIKFLGASVRSVSSQIAWDSGGASQLNVSLAEDPVDGDAFAPGALLRPVYFSMGGFEFNGILQRYHKREEAGGYPTYEVVVVDPREILDGAKLILGGYSGAVTVPNLVNIYGWWESQGFGLSQADETGMYWSKIATALNAIMGTPAGTDYGSPLNYHGYAYGLDLSQLPATNAYYKISNNTTLSLLELISQVCDDHGCNFFVDLVGTTIRVRTVSRASQPALGVLNSLVDATRGTTMVRADTGLEGRNEVTSSFLFGGEVRSLNICTDITSYWGTSDAGSPVLGTATRLDLVNDNVSCLIFGGVTNANTVIEISFSDVGFTPFNVYNDQAIIPFYIKTESGEIIKVVSRWAEGFYLCERGQFGTTPTAYVQDAIAYLCYDAVDCDYMVLNSAPVSDLIGSATYPCTTFELRLVKGLAGIAGWSAYVQHFRPLVAQLLGLLPPVRNAGWNGRQLAPDLINDAKAFADAAAVAEDAWAKTQRFYEWLRSYADEYMGRKFAVALPFVSHKQNAETLRISTSYEIDDGGWLEEGATPLGLSTLNQDAFKTQDGRFRAFADYYNVAGADLSQASPASTVLEAGKFYTTVEVDPNLIYTPGPAAVVTVPGPVFDSSADWMGGYDLLAAMLQMAPPAAAPIFQGAAFGSVGVKIAPAHRAPDTVAVPLRSNTQTYGPWYVAGGRGKVHVEQDATLVPWNYGGYDLMAAVAQARVTTAATNALIVESGLREEVGLPTASLGDVLQAGGPNITGIQITYGDRGFTTSYSFSTFTPFNRAGFFSRSNQEKVRRLALTQAQLRKSVRAALRGNQARALQRAEAARVNKAFFGELPKVVRKQSPHDVLVAQTYYDDLTLKTRTGVAGLTSEELIGAVNSDDDATYQRTAAMSLNGLLRPFTTEAGATTMTAYAEPVPSGGLDRHGLDPWKAANDVEFLVSGDTYPDGIHAYRRGATLGKARPIGLRGPLVVAGWGFDTEGNPVPGSGGAFPGNYLHEPATWKAGPVDLLWDEYRAVWTCHDVSKGVARQAIAASVGGSGLVSVYHDAADTGRHVYCYNWSSTPVASGTPVNLFLNALDRKWYAQSAEAGSGSVSTSAPIPSSLFSFHSPEFVVDSGATPYEVRANWGSGILPVAFASLDGSGELFARYDHVHAHPVFASGDLHPEYRLPVAPTGAAGYGGGGYLSLSASGTYGWQYPTALVEVGASIADTCLYSGHLMHFAASGAASGASCCWSSGEAVYFHYLSPAHSGAYVPAMYAGLREGRAVYTSLAAGVDASGVTICYSSGASPPASGVDTSCCSGVPTTLYMTFTDVSGCGCLDGDVVQMNYWGDYPGPGIAWSGTWPSACDAGVYNVTLECTGGTWAVGGEAPFLASPTTTSCDPLVLEANNILAVMCGQFSIAVTE